MFNMSIIRSLLEDIKTPYYFSIGAARRTLNENTPSSACADTVILLISSFMDGEVNKNLIKLRLNMINPYKVKLLVMIIGLDDF